MIGSAKRNIYEETQLQPDEQVEFLLQNPDRMPMHWMQYIGIFGSVEGATPGCGCPVQLRERDVTCGIREVDSILDGGDEDGNRIPKSWDWLSYRWQRAGILPNTDRIRRKILAPFVKIRKILNARNKD